MNDANSLRAYRAVDLLHAEQEKSLARAIRQDQPKMTWGTALRDACRILGRPINGAPAAQGGR